MIEWLNANKETILLLLTNIAAVIAVAVPKLVGDGKTRKLLSMVTKVQDKTKIHEGELNKMTESTINAISRLDESLVALKNIDVYENMVNKQLDRISELAATINGLKTQMDLLSDELRKLNNTNMVD